MAIKAIKILILTAVFLICVSAHAGFDEEKARNFLNATGEKFIQTLGLEDLAQKYKILDDMFEQNFDTRAMGRFVLGKTYNRLSEEQKAQYHDLFTRYIKSLYKTYPLDFDASEIKYRIVQVNQTEKYVVGVVALDLPEQLQTENLKTVRVEFKLEPKDDDSYLIFDVLIADVSMLVTLRGRFAKMMKEADDEPEWFLEDFEDLTVSNEKQVLLP